MEYAPIIKDGSSVGVSTSSASPINMNPTVLKAQGFGNTELKYVLHLAGASMSDAIAVKVIV